MGCSLRLMKGTICRAPGVSLPTVSVVGLILPNLDQLPGLLAALLQHLPQIVQIGLQQAWAVRSVLGLP